MKVEELNLMLGNLWAGLEKATIGPDFEVNPPYEPMSSPFYGMDQPKLCSKCSCKG